MFAVGVETCNPAPHPVTLSCTSKLRVASVCCPSSPRSLGLSRTAQIPSHVAPLLDHRWYTQALLTTEFATSLLCQTFCWHLLSAVFSSILLSLHFWIPLLSSGILVVVEINICSQPCLLEGLFVGGWGRAGNKCHLTENSKWKQQQ